MHKALLAFGLSAGFGLLALFFSASEQLTGALIHSCPEGFFPAGEHCIEHECQDKQAKCIVNGTLVHRPRCECLSLDGTMLCGIPFFELSAAKSKNCTRHGQMGKLCGAHDTRAGHCVGFDWTP